jgi:hypothetical protein
MRTIFLLTFFLVSISRPVWAASCYESFDKFNTCMMEQHHESRCDRNLILDYTSILYLPLNEAIREESSNEFCQEVGKRLEAAVLKLPAITGTVYRGTPVFSRLKKITVSNQNDCFFDNAFLSTSKDIEVAFRFSQTSHGAILKINTTSGRDITTLAALDEKEILIPPHTLLKLMKRPYFLKGRMVFEFQEVSTRECTYKILSLDK